MEQPLDLSRRRILVTGAASGIGRASCELLSRLGGRVVAVDANAQGLEQTLDQCQGQGHDGRCCDLRNVEALPSLLSEVAASCGPLFGLVHAAGLSCIQPARLLDPSRYRDVMLVNTEAALALARGFQSRSQGRSWWSMAGIQLIELGEEL